MRRAIAVAAAIGVGSAALLALWLAGRRAPESAAEPRPPAVRDPGAAALAAEAARAVREGPATGPIPLAAEGLRAIAQRWAPPTEPPAKTPFAPPARTLDVAARETRPLLSRAARDVTDRARFAPRAQQALPSPSKSHP
jgi:hypothetical protein